MSRFLSFFVFGLFFAFPVAQADTTAVAGLRPWERPVGAPRLTADLTAEARAALLRGIPAPHTGLDFIKDQGAWYTPFGRPNLPGRYDIRQLHTTATDALPGQQKGQ